MDDYFVASVSWGKDSTAMLHLLLDRGDPLDEVVSCDPGELLISDAVALLKYCGFVI